MRKALDSSLANEKILGKCCFLDSWIEIQSCLVAAMSIQGTSAQCQLITEGEVSPSMTAHAHDNHRQPMVIAHARLLYMASVSVGYVNRKVSASSQQFQALGCMKVFWQNHLVQVQHVSNNQMHRGAGKPRGLHTDSLSTHTHRCHWWQHSSDDLATAFSAKDGVRIEPKFRKKLPWHKKGTVCRHNKSTGATGPTYKRKRLGNLVRGWMQLFGKCM